MAQRKKKRPSTNGSNGRDARGRFTKGNPGGPGNPYARRVANLRSRLLAEGSDDDLAEIARRLVKLARSGNLAAAKVLFSYTLGPPQPGISPDSVDVDEARVTLQRHFAFKQLDGELALAEGRLPTFEGCNVRQLSDAELMRRLTELYKERS